MKQVALVLMSALLAAPLSAEAARCAGFDAGIECLVEQLSVDSSSTVADIGAGNGKHAIAIAARARVVYATEIDEALREKISKRAREAGRTNVVVVEAGVAETGLPNDCCDAIYMRGVYHHITQPAPFLQSVKSALNSGGTLTVVDFPPTIWLWFWKPEGIPDNRGGHGIRRQLVEREVLAAGFERIGLIEDWSSRWPTRMYGISFRKP